MKKLLLIITILAYMSSRADVIDAGARYGIRPGIDNSSGFMQMQHDLSMSAIHYDVYLPSGLLLTSNPRWTYNLLNVHFYGTQTIIRSIYSGNDEKFQRGLLVSDPWQTNLLTYTGGIAWVPQSLTPVFNSVRAGSNFIVLKDNTLTNNFHVGNRVLLYGYQQIGNGQPPGTRYNEWHTIVSVGNGIVTFREPLQNSFDSAWKDVVDLDGGPTAGKPRMLLLDRQLFDGYVYPYSMEFSGISFGGTWQVVGMDVRLHYCSLEGNAWPTESKYVLFDNVETTGDPSIYGGEFDKVLGKVDVLNSHFRIFVCNATGADTVFCDHDIFDQSVWLCPRYLTIQNCNMRGDLYPNPTFSPLDNAPQGSPIRSYTIKNDSFTRSSANTAMTAMNLPYMRSYTITNIKGGTIVIPFVSDMDPVSTLLPYTAEAGYTTIFREDGAKTGLVTNITWNASFNNGKGAYEISGSWLSPPAVGEVWKWSTVASFTDLNGNKDLSGFPQGLASPSSMKYIGNNNGLYHEMHLRGSEIDMSGHDDQAEFYARIWDISGYILSPDIGTPQSGAFLNITDDNFKNIFTLDLRTNGSRKLTKSGATGAAPADHLDNTRLMIWQKHLHIFIRDKYNNNLKDQTRPQFDIKIRYY